MPVECVCQNPACGTVFFVKPSYAAHQHRGKYCSQPCYWQSKQNKEVYTCFYCGHDFRRAPSLARQRKEKYCSWACYKQAKHVPYPQRVWRFVQKCVHLQPCLYCCWPWQGARNLQEYGSVTKDDRSKVNAHRAVWELWHERIMPPDLDAAHYCHTPSCCNPMHTHPATEKENWQESVKAGRQPRGESHGMTTLTQVEVLYIWSRKGIEPALRLALHFHVTDVTIYNIWNQKTWGHITGLPLLENPS
jgi:hypothetical protein